MGGTPNAPIWIRSDKDTHFTNIVADDSEDESLDMSTGSSSTVFFGGGVPRGHHQFLINSVVVIVGDDDAGGMTADFNLYFYHNSTFEEGGTTPDIDSDSIIGVVAIADAQEFNPQTPPDTATEVHYFVDHDVNLHYFDSEAPAAGRPRLHVKLAEANGTGTLAADDTVVLVVGLTPLFL
jgi:hypothetical protein